MRTVSQDSKISSEAAAIDRLLISASRPQERREAERFPFFQPVQIAINGKPSGQRAFSREISQSGIGLVHEGPVQAGKVILTIDDGSVEPAKLNVELLWCRPCGDGWYISGGRFVFGDGNR